METVSYGENMQTKEGINLLLKTQHWNGQDRKDSADNVWIIVPYIR
jgi:hypothetical protein